MGLSFVGACDGTIPRSSNKEPPGFVDGATDTGGGGGGDAAAELPPPAKEAKGSSELAMLVLLFDVPSLAEGVN